MRAPFSIEHEFVERIPPDRKERTLYVSIPFATAVHNCMCGCGTKIVTPISPPQWKLTFDGETVSLWPSVGSSGLACGSHYIIERDQVIWAPKWTDAQIAAGRARDKSLRDRHFHDPKPATPASPPVAVPPPIVEPAGQTWLQRLIGFFK